MSKKQTKTSANTQTKALAKPENVRKIKGTVAESFSFKNIGDSVEGILKEYGVKQFPNQEMPTMVLTLDIGKEISIRFFAPTYIRNWMVTNAFPIGQWIKFTYTGAQEVGAPAPMKVFDIECDENILLSNSSISEAELQQAFLPTTVKIIDEAKRLSSGKQSNLGF